jgi:predicted nuclease of restriction endonuclease-like (RecB) superfamily
MNSRHSDTSSRNLLVKQLVAVLSSRCKNVNRIANAELTTLFWEIGKILNESSGKSTGKRAMPLLISRIAPFLAENYGPYFLGTNLKRMIRFARFYPGFSAVEEFIPLASWNYIRLLLELKTPGARAFYLSLKIKEALSKEDLQKVISSKLYEEDVEAAAGIASAQLTNKLPLLCDLDQTTFSRNDATAMNLFKHPSLPSFRALVKPGATQIPHKNKQNTEHSFPGGLINKIEEFRLRQNQFLNASVTLLFWDIGKRISESITEDHDPRKQRNLLAHFAQLKKTSSKSFGDENLTAMTEFATKVSDPRIVGVIAYLVNWEHILVLLNLQETEDLLHYAGLAASRGLSPAELQKEITRTKLTRTHGLKSTDQEILASLGNSTTKVDVTKKGSSTETITAHFFESDLVKHSKATGDVFANPYFIDLITLFQRN